MPGSAMFLIQGSRGTVLHTGDMRAESSFLEELITNSHLCTIPLQASPVTSDESGLDMRNSLHFSVNSQDQHSPRENCLQNIYLDTERLLDGEEPCSKLSVIADILQLIRMFPDDQHIYIDTWTFGYEALLLALHNAFDCSQRKIHVDRYKADLYRIMTNESSWKVLEGIVSTDKSRCGRFCACSQEECRRHAIVLQPEESMGQRTWKQTKASIKRMIKSSAAGRSHFATSIPFPLQRHSPLPELYRMIAMLRPLRVTANSAVAPACFVLARISERLRLGYSDDSDAWQRAQLCNQGGDQLTVWSAMQEAWCQARADGVECSSDDVFYEVVNRFRQLGLKQIQPDSRKMQVEKKDCTYNIVDLSHSSTSSIQPWVVDGKYASAHASPFRTASMRTQRFQNHLPVDTNNTNLTANNLSIELASRYLAYAAMFLGWKIRNPSRYPQDIAWRALRKLRPDLARRTEEDLHKELGWPIPVWTDEQKTKGAVEAALTRSVESQQRLQEQSRAPSPPLGDICASHHSSVCASAPLSHLLGYIDMERRDQDDTRNRDQALLSCNRISKAECKSKSEWRSLGHQRSNGVDDKQYAIWSHCLRYGRHSRRLRIRASKIYDTILSEWARILWNARHSEQLPVVNRTKLVHQLTIVGSAARSGQARSFLEWEGVDFRKAYRILVQLSNTLSKPRQLYSNRNADTDSTLMPRRTQVVLRYLSDSVS